MWFPGRPWKLWRGNGASGRDLWLLPFPGLQACVLCESWAWSRKRAWRDPPSSYAFPLPPTALGVKGAGAVSLERQRISTDVLAPGMCRPPGTARLLVRDKNGPQSFLDIKPISNYSFVA